MRCERRVDLADDAHHVQVVFYDLTGNLLGVLNVADQQPDRFLTWYPTGDVPSLLAPTIGATSFRATFTSLAARGTRQVDGVFVDPWVSGA